MIILNMASGKLHNFCSIRRILTIFSANDAQRVRPTRLNRMCLGNFDFIVFWSAGAKIAKSSGVVTACPEAGYKKYEKNRRCALVFCGSDLLTCVKIRPRILILWELARTTLRPHVYTTVIFLEISQKLYSVSAITAVK